MDSPVAFVTGTSRGIGRGLAKRFLATGYRVVGCSRGEAPDVEGDYTHISLDVTDEKAVRACVSSVRKSHGGIDVVVNNAGVGAIAPALTTPGATIEELTRVNYLGTFLVSREVAKMMIRNGGGRIINFASVATSLHMEGSAAYAASKAAVIEFSKVLAREVASRDVTVNVVAPSLVETDMYDTLNETAVERYREALTIKRSITMDEVFAVVCFLASNEASALTGQVLYLGLAD
jgi:3-oxoacyl-[acyl-carrier protein] reductase